jgi:sortase A
MKKIFSVFLISIGIIIISYPRIKVIYSNYKQKEIIKSWQESIKNMDDYEAVYVKTDKKYDNNNIKDNSNIKPYKQETGASRKSAKNNIEGMISIEKINLNLPILKGASKSNLNISVCRLDNCGEMGQVGNYIIAGHRSHSYGVLFNRLDELDIGDEIKISKDNDIYIYKVYEKICVDAENIEPLKPKGNEKTISLVTCDYKTTPAKRLIIHGKIE